MNHASKLNQTTRHAAVGRLRAPALACVLLVAAAGWIGDAAMAQSLDDGLAAGMAAARTDVEPVSNSDPIPSKNLLGIIGSGGVLMIPLMLCSFLLLVFVFERLISLRRGRVIPRPFVKRFLHQLREGQLNREDALALCEENGSTVAVVFAAAVRKWGRPAVEVEQAVLDGGERAVNGLKKYLRVFNGVATVSPLLGLLGTVFGMIRAFNEIATSDAMGRPELLAAGISEALITTATGLAIAIPSLTFYLFFVSRVDQLIIQIDALGMEVVSLVSAEGLAAAPSQKSTRTRTREQAA